MPLIVRQQQYHRKNKKSFHISKSLLYHVLSRCFPQKKPISNEFEKTQQQKILLILTLRNHHLLFYYCFRNLLEYLKIVSNECCVFELSAEDVVKALIAWMVCTTKISISNIICCYDVSTIFHTFWTITLAYVRETLWMCWVASC